MYWIDNISALKYKREIEIEAVNTFVECIKNYHHDCIISECEFALNETMPYNRSITDQLMSCSCCGKTCIEIKCLYSINYKEPNDQNSSSIYDDEGGVKLKQNH